MTNNPIGEPIPRGLVSVHNRDVTPLPQQYGVSTEKDAWNELAAVGWNLAFLPALTWASFVTAGSSAWQSWFNGDVGAQEAVSAPHP